MKHFYTLIAILLLTATPAMSFNATPSFESEVVVDYWESLKIYPNPSTNYLYIENAKGAVLDVFDVTGKTIMSRQLTRNRFVIDVNTWNEGVYFFRFRGDRGVETKKVIVE